MQDATDRTPAEGLTAGDTLPGLLRRLRGARRWTQAEAARAAGVGRVTVSRWEAGAQTPRAPELEALLSALGAGPGDRRRALGLAGTPGARALALAPVRRLADGAGLGALPGGGDLLRALRLRRGRDAGAAASAAGVGASALRRWEAGDAWPDAARLHALCWALGALPEEVAALTVGPFAPSARADGAGGGHGPDAGAHERLDGRLDALDGRVAAGDLALIDLHCLALQADAWRLALGGDRGRRLLSRACQVHAMALSFRGRVQDARRQAERAMALWPVSVPREPIWFYCGVLVVQGLHEGGTRWGARRGRRTLGPLLDAVSPRAAPSWGSLEAWMLSELAVCLSREGADDEALAVGARSLEVAERKVGPEEQARRRSALAGLLLGRGCAADALALLDGVPGTTPYHGADMALMRVEASLAVGSVASACTWLGEAHRLVRRHDMSYLRDRADALAARL